MANEISSVPGAPQQVPGLPSNFSPLIFEQFGGLDTKALRPGIRDELMSWCDGFMPIGPNNARILPGTGPDIASFPGRQVQWFGFGNISNTNYCYVLTADGALTAVNMQTLGRTLVMPAGTVQNPRSIFGFSQWGAQYAIFAIDQLNGYWLWDGTNLYTAGAIGPDVTVGAGGQSYNGSPTYTIQTTGAGSGVVLDFEIQNGEIDRAMVADPGTGFALNDLIVATLQGGGTDSQAVVSAVVDANHGGLAEVYVISGGSGYSGFAYARVAGGTVRDATVSLSIQNGVITGAAIVTGGQGYGAAPNIVVVDPGIPSENIPGGSGGEIGCTIGIGQVTGINIASGGSGYRSPPTVMILGDGTDAAAVATVQSGIVTGIAMTNFGSGYTKALAVLQGGNNAGNITLALMPFGISGTTVEVYENHVWIGNGAAVATFPPQSRVIFSDPDSPVGFGNGGGAFASTDAFLRVGYKVLKQSNGFLYLVGDSSMNYISGVQTSSSGTSSVPAVPVTTFGNLNVDPQIGTPWPGSLQVFSRNLVFANTVGVHVSYGGAIKKVSDPLDGFYATGNIFGAAANFTSAVAHIFAIAVYMLLLPVQDLYTGRAVRKLLMWDGKRWFTSNQDRSPAFISTYEQNSVLTAYGTDGTSIFPLFDQPSTGFRKIIQSKLFANPGYFATKQSRSLSGVINYYTNDDELTVTIDSEAGNGTGNALVPITQQAGLIWTNIAGSVVSWVNRLGNPVTWGGNGIVVFGPVPVGQQGRLIGMTAYTNASDMALLSLMLSDMVETPNV